MSFHGKAWEAAAAEYGRVRAERYGRLARAWQWFKILAFLAGVIVIVVVARS